MKTRPRALLATAGLAGLALIPSAQGAHAAVAVCTPVTNIEAIIDDSGSMSLTDPSRLRVSAMDLLIQTPGNEKVTFGAIEFGGAFFSTETATDTLFPPEPIGPNAAAMEAAMNAKVQADNGGTDYNAAFAKAKADDPAAKAWIFLTDGGHNVGEYQNGHRGGPPTYVISFGSGISPSDAQRLQLIANETGGKYFPQTDASNLQAVVNEIGTTLTCQSVPVTFKDVLKAGQRRLHSVALGAKARSAQLTLSWASPLDQFTISKLRVIRRGRTVATGARVRRIKVTRRQGSTFLVVKLSGLVRGKLQFAVRAAKVGSGAPKVSLTTQVSQSG